MRETIVLDGVVYSRYPQSNNLSDRRYFKCHPTTVAKLGIEAYYHRELWRRANGPIPDNCHIHHDDGNHDNNALDNLVCMDKTEHLQYHAEQRTEEEIERARQNLAINVRPKASEWHRSDAGRQWHSQIARNMWEKRQPEIYICDHCGAEYQTRDIGGHRFCSNACKTAFRVASGVDDELRQCQRCGETFMANKYQTTKYCSRECRYRKD